MLFNDLVLLCLPLLFLLLSLLFDFLLAELGSLSSILNLLVLVLLDDGALVLMFFVPLPDFSLRQDLVASILLLRQFNFHLNL